MNMNEVGDELEGDAYSPGNQESDIDVAELQFHVPKVIGERDRFGSENSNVEQYIQNCRKYQVPVDPSVVISLKTRWHIMQPTKSFCEGAMLPLSGILDTNDHIKTLLIQGAGMHNRKPAAGNGNSNARVLRTMLSTNRTIENINLSYTGLDNEGVLEISKALSETDTLLMLNLSRNRFSSKGAKSLEDAIQINKSLKVLDVSRNALGFRSINALQQKCLHRHKGCCPVTIHTDGNYVFEEVLNSVSHALGFVMSLIGSILLMSEASKVGQSPVQFWACAIFSTSLMILYLSSTLFHSFFMIPHVAHVLQIADHVAIYLLIAGSYTPFIMIGLHGSRIGAVVVVVQWIAACIGSIYSICADIRSSLTMVVELTLYLGMGLAVLTMWNEVVQAFEPGALYLLVGGGAAYVIGVVFFVIGETIPIYHVIWHVFVMAASSMHWFAIYLYLVSANLSSICEPTS